jgi:glycosyltransferase involved in cell wall biosynthesis
LSNKEVLNYYRNNPVDLFINVSESEGIPVSIMEAISFGIPVIATNVGGTSEIVTDKFGILLPKNISASELSKTIDEFISRSVEDKKKMKLHAFSYWENNFNADTNYQEFSKFLFTLLQQSKNNPKEN